MLFRSTQKASASTSCSVRIDESTDGGVVVTALQVVEPGIGIIKVATVANGVDVTNAISIGNGDGEDVAPGIVLILAEGCAQVANDPDHVTLLIQNIVIPGTVIHTGIGQAAGIIDDVEDINDPL